MRTYLLFMVQRLDFPAKFPFRRRGERATESPSGAEGARPVAVPLPATGRAASDTLLHEVESLMAAERALHLFRSSRARRRAGSTLS